MDDHVDPVQVRGARAMLGWSIADLATATNLSSSTIKRIEDESYESVSMETWRAVQHALESAGVTFLDEDADGVGVRMRRRRSVLRFDH